MGKLNPRPVLLKSVMVTVLLAVTVPVSSAPAGTDVENPTQTLSPTSLQERGSDLALTHRSTFDRVTDSTAYLHQQLRNRSPGSAHRLHRLFDGGKILAESEHRNNALEAKKQTSYGSSHLFSWLVSKALSDLIDIVRLRQSHV